MGFGFLGQILVLSLLFKPIFCQQQPNTDGYLLSDFFQKMNSESSKFHNFSAHVCSWKGVFCDAKQDHVIGLVASGLNLSGVIPDTTIGKLGKLQSLDLSNNKITGVSSDFWSLGSLKSLNLSNNIISGPLPSNIGNFGLLETFDISSNNVSLEFPLGIMNCKALVSIDFSMNRVNGKLPRGLGAAFPKLKWLNLAGNEIQGRAMDFSELKSIAYLNISGNLFQGSVMALFQDSLEVMDLSKNQFSGYVSQVQFNPSFNWSNLVYLDLSENELSGQIFYNLSNAQNLKHINLAHNRFSPQNFPVIRMLLDLEYLNLSGSSLIGHIPTELAQMSSLNTLDLSTNHLIGHIPFFNTKTLKILDFSLNNLTGEIPLSLLGKLRYMERFNFSYNNLTLCASEFSTQTLKTAFIGSQNSCPIAADPKLFKRKGGNHNGLKLALALTLSLIFLLAMLLCLAFCCRKKRTKWSIKQTSYKEDQNVSGPFSFQTDSTTWVADVKQASSVPVVIFEKPLLNFTFADLLSATSHFERGTLLAEGRFGPVYRGFLPGGIHVAVKVLVHGSTMTDEEAATELEYLGRIKHPNLVPLTGYCLAGDQRIAIYDYMENGNLQNLLHDLPLGVQTTEDWSMDTWEEQENLSTGIQNVGSEGTLTTWSFRHKIALGTARALAYLHHGCSPPIVHRDVKASSVYLDSNMEPRISDFGLAKIFGNAIDDDMTLWSPGYMPPEFSHSGSPKIHTPKSDVYGFGVILFELLTGKKAVGDDYGEERDTTTLVCWMRGLLKRNEGSRAIDPKLRGTGPEHRMVEALKFGYLCTAEAPSKRPTMQQIVGLLKDIEPASNQYAN